MPGRFIANQIVRPCFALSSFERFAQSELPSRLVDPGRSSLGFIARVRVDKYGVYPPLYRQSQTFKRVCDNLDRSTMADWVGKSTVLLKPLAGASHLCGRHLGRDPCARHRQDADGAVVGLNTIPVRCCFSA